MRGSSDLNTGTGNPDTSQRTTIVALFLTSDTRLPSILRPAKRGGIFVVGSRHLMPHLLLMFSNIVKGALIVGIYKVFDDLLVTGNRKARHLTCNVSARFLVYGNNFTPFVFLAVRSGWNLICGLYT
jgi:hypothetical protein